MTNPKAKNTMLVVAYIHNFMKEDYVICETDNMACAISGSTRYTGIINKNLIFIL